MKIKLSILILLASVFALFAYSVKAQTSSDYDVTISPVFFDLSANPGDKISNKIRIRNNTTSPLPIKLLIQKMTGDANGELTLKDTQNDDSLSWIKFENNAFVAKPLEWTNVPFTIDIPKTAAFGYYFAISFTQDNSSPLKITGTKITGAAAVPILLNVRKTGAKAEAKILQFNVNSFINEYLPVDFKIKIQNTGNIHVKPHGNIFINEGGLEKNLAVLDVNGALGSIIPDTNKTLEASWDDGFLVREPVLENGQAKLDKNGKQLEKLTINWNKLTSFRIGRYTANLLLVYDNGKKDIPIESSLSFWVFPWRALIVMIVSLIALVILIRFLLKFYINREIKKRLRSR